MHVARPIFAIAFSLLLAGFTASAQTHHTSALVAPADHYGTAPARPAADASTTATSVALANTADLRQFNDLLSMAGLRKRLSKPDETYTVFASTNAAIGKVPFAVRDRMFRSDNDGLKRLMRNHLVQGRVELDQLADGAELKTVDGSIIHVSRQPDGTVLLNGSTRVQGTGQPTANGMIYTIDSILNPAQ